MKPIKIMHVVGARPNFMKVAPIVREMARLEREFKQMLVHTGQHYDRKLSEVFIGDLGLPEPDVNLEAGSGSHARQTAEIMLRFEPVLSDFQPDWLLVPGDVNSTLACALVASKLGIRIAHVEAGLRSFDRTMPEEINRLLTDQVSDLLLIPSWDARTNLVREGIEPQKIRFVGNVMIDTLVRLLPKAEERWQQIRGLIRAERFVLVTLHRPSNVDSPATLVEIIRALSELADEIPVIFPVHPRTQRQIAAFCADMNLRHPGFQLTDPVGYLDFLAFQVHASLVLTDSGGVQEETTYLGVPCLTLRANTERPVTVTNGTNQLVESKRAVILSSARDALCRENGKTAARPRPEYWDGHAAERIVAELRRAPERGSATAPQTVAGAQLPA
jgi:UDP-N-acetylglucosamine 2-epimerase (non-hydrolysing)